MKKSKILVAVVLILAMLLTTACGSNGSSKKDKDYSYSSSLDENGYWEGIKALNLVTLGSYDDILVTQADINKEIEAFKAQFPILVDKSGAIETGDVVNIDFVGYIDGEAFENGSSNGNGYSVEIGSGMMIPGFEDGLIGHNIGDHFDLNAHFPDYYDVEELRDKDAVFDVTVNAIQVYADPEIDDDFVFNNLSAKYGWTTVEEMNNSIRAQLAMASLRSASTFKEVPQSMIDYQADMLVSYYKSYSQAYGLEFEDFLKTYVGVVDEAGLRENSADYCKNEAEFALFIQAVAEDKGIVATEDDVKEFYQKNYGDDASVDMSYDAFVEQFGLPYLKCMILNTLVEQYFADNFDVK